MYGEEQRLKDLTVQVLRSMCLGKMVFSYPGLLMHSTI